MPFVTSRSVWLPEKRVSWAHPSARIRSVVRFTTGSPFAQVRFTTQTHVAARREPKPTKNTHLMQPAHTTLLQSARKNARDYHAGHNDASRRLARGRGAGGVLQVAVVAVRRGAEKRRLRR